MSELSRDSASRGWRADRWRLALVGFGLGVLYTAAALLVGLEIRLGDRDVTLLVGSFIELSFAAWGYLLGLAIEARRRERTAAERIQQQMQQLASIRQRLAHSEKLASLGQLAGTIAHRGPQSSGDPTVDGAEPAESSADPEIDDTCAQLIEEIDRLSRVTTSLLDLAKPVTLQRSRVSGA